MKIVALAILWVVLILISMSDFPGPKKSSADFPGDPNRMFSMMKLKVTAYYTPLKNQNAFATGSYAGDRALNGRGVTFSGYTADYGSAAADLSILPLGTKILVPGHGVVVVDDKGSKIVGNRLDVWVGEGEKGLEKAKQWGEKELDVFILSGRGA